MMDVLLPTCEEEKEVAPRLGKTEELEQKSQR